MRYRTAKTFFRHPDKPMGICFKVRSLRMRSRSIEDIGDCFTLMGRQCCYVNERVNPIMMGRGDHHTGIRMCH